MALLASDGPDYCPTDDKSLNFLYITDFLICKNKVMMIYLSIWWILHYYEIIYNDLIYITNLHLKHLRLFKERLFKLR